jgi:DNA polymerase I
MTKTETTEQNTLTPLPPLEGGLSRYTDYALITGLSGRRHKKDFVSWVDQEFEVTATDTPENRVSYIQQKLTKQNWIIEDLNSPPEKGESEGVIQKGILNNETPPNLPFSGEGRYWDKPSFIHDLEASLIPVLARMEYRGVAFDRERLADIGERIRTDIAKLETEIHELVWPINISSPKQLQVLFFETLGIKPTKKNKTGYSVDVDVLEEIAKSYDIARLILEYRWLSKLSSTYVDGLMKSIGDDRRIHTTYDSLGAATGRMSSNDPNLQNIPTGDGYAREIKECFIATRWIQNSKWKIYWNVSSWGQNESTSNTESWILNLESEYLLLVADYSQVELRILAFLSQDANLLEAFADGEDIHARTAFFLFGDKTGGNKETWRATSEQRRIAKSVNFGVIYGITGFGLAKTLDCSPWEAQQYVEAFYTKYPGVRTYYDTLLADARLNGYVETYFGRKRYIPWVNDANKTMRAIAEREAMNMPVQGTAADIIKIAMVELDAKIRELKLEWKMILQVHDELVFDIPLSEKEIFEKLVQGVMEGVLKNSKFSEAYPMDKIQNSKPDTTASENFESWIHNLESSIPPITVDISTGANWAEAK